MAELRTPGPLHPAAPQRREVGGLSIGLDHVEASTSCSWTPTARTTPRRCPASYRALDAGLDLVTGRRAVRNDRFVKRTTSKLYNGVTAKVTGVPGKDFNSGLKAMTRELADTLEMYGELHRYIPVLAVWNGFRVGELDVEHHERRHGTSKFGRARFWRGFLDLVTVKFLTTYTARPFHLFGGIGFVIGLVGARAARVDGRLQAHRPRHRHPPGSAARRAARRGGRPDGVPRPARRAHGEPPAAPQPRRHGRRRPPAMTAPATSRPIGLAPGAPEAAAGQDAKKYATGNPVVQRLLAAGWAAQGRAGPRRRHRHRRGVGEGLALERMIAGHPAIGLEYRVDKVLAAASGSPARGGGRCRHAAGRSGGADLVTCIELLEHLEPFDPAVAELARITGGRCVVSVPWEPWFRLGNLGRGKNLRRLGNDPEHVQAFTPGRLHRALEADFSEVRVVKAFPWLIAEARRPRP